MLGEFDFPVSERVAFTLNCNDKKHHLTKRMNLIIRKDVKILDST